MIDIIQRAYVTAVQAAKKLQVVQVSTGKGAGAPVDEGEHFEPLGVTARPLSGAEAILAFVLGPDHPIVLAVADRRYRPTDLEAGETALYNCHGQRVYLRNGSVLLGALTATAKVACEGHSIGIDLSDPANAQLLAILTAAAAPGALPIPSTIVGAITDGSSVVKAVP